MQELVFTEGLADARSTPVFTLAVASGIFILSV